MDSVLFESLFSDQLFAVPSRPVIVINQPWEKIGPEERILLSKILAAIKLSIDAVTIKSQTSLDISSWPQKPKSLIYFGDPVKGILQYEVIEANGVSVVASENLKDLLKNDAARKKLWQALKVQFAI